MRMLRFATIDWGSSRRRSWRNLGAALPVAKVWLAGLCRSLFERQQYSTRLRSLGRHGLDRVGKTLVSRQELARRGAQRIERYRNEVVGKCIPSSVLLSNRKIWASRCCRHMEIGNVMRSLPDEEGTPRTSLRDCRSHSG
jgi:hypothetical protein